MQEFKQNKLNFFKKWTLYKKMKHLGMDIIHLYKIDYENTLISIFNICLKFNYTSNSYKELIISIKPPAEEYLKKTINIDL